MTEREFLKFRLETAIRDLAKIHWPEDVLYYNGRIHELKWFLSGNWSNDDEDIDRLWPV